ncbi:hypothetical protein KP79_PYT07312 [Mizuhopecten yessoensis]|uniref:Uncharacterized protein n=1 Tax=Mizuhopecten yessoensis TaxID=6573 RepID=A0A210QB11_MIZYE|nr:hypothetical protein KP79_PYT07312 [Mizuhopecten yessoensis]
MHSTDVVFVAPTQIENHIQITDIHIKYGSLGYFYFQPEVDYNGLVRETYSELWMPTRRYEIKLR